MAIPTTTITLPMLVVKKELMYSGLITIKNKVKNNIIAHRIPKLLVIV